MRALILILSCLLFANTISLADQDSVRIVKTLRHLLDLDGKHTTSPSLLDRDAYQAHLRDQPDEVSGLRFDVQMRVPRDVSDFRIQVEIRHGQGKELHTFSKEAPIVRKNRRRSIWQEISIVGKDYQGLGEVLAWRVSIWRGEERVASDESFLW